jgi:hypothetical protein
MGLVGKSLQNVEDRGKDAECSADAGESVNHWNCCYFSNQYDNKESQPEDGYVRLGPVFKAYGGGNSNAVRIQMTMIIPRTALFAEESGIMLEPPPLWPQGQSRPENRPARTYSLLPL